MGGTVKALEGRPDDMNQEGQPATTHPKAFICHASKDQDRFVTDFARRLVGNGVNAWYAKWEMNAGDKLIRRVFEEGIGNTDNLIIVLSKNSVTSPWVIEEIDAGFVRRVVEKNIRLIPVVIDKNCKIPVALQSTLYVRIEDLASYEAELDQIVAAIFGLSDKPELGSVPAHAQSQLVGIPKLARLDNIVLRLACEDAIEDGSFTSNPDRVWTMAEPLGLSRQDTDDSLTILSNNHFIEAHRGSNKILAFEITLFGFHEYAKAYIADIDSVLTAVIARIVNDGMTDSGSIRESVGQPGIIIEYILRLLADNGHFTLSKPLGRGREMYILDVSPELKRMLE